MKKIFFLVISIFFSTFIYAQNYYYSSGEKSDVDICKEHFLVYFDKTQITKNEIYSSFNVIKEISMSVGKSDRLIACEVEIPNNDYENVLDSLKSLNYIWTIEPVIGKKNYIPVSNIFYVKVKSINDICLLENIANETGSSIIGSMSRLPLWYILETNKNSRGNALEISNYFYETGLFEDVDPGFILDFTQCSLDCTTDDSLFYQWGLDAINACEAWETTTGDTNVRVSLIDSGLDINHSEFCNTNIVADYCATDNINYISNPDIHGTHVGGIIFADHNHARMAGISPNASMINIQNITVEDYERRIEGYINSYTFSGEHSADILNNSWGVIPGIIEEVPNASSLMSVIQTLPLTMRGGKGGGCCF